MTEEDLELLVTRAMPFGKFEGRLIADLPGHYLNWFARVGFPKGEIGRLLELMQEIDHNGLRPLLDPLRRNTGDRAEGPDKLPSGQDAAGTRRVPDRSEPDERNRT